MEQVHFCGWNCYRLTSGGVGLIVAPEIGGRVISLTHRDEEIFYVQKGHQGETFDFSKVSGLRAEKRRLGHRFWGGDKTWVAPQKDWSEGVPPLELDAGRYEFHGEGDRCVMTSPVCRETGLQIIRRLHIQSDGRVHLDQEMINHGREPVRKGIWNVTQLLRPFDVYLAASKDRLRSYHEEDLTLPSHDIVVTEQDGWCKIPCRDNTLFKFGGMAEAGAILSLRESQDGTLALLKTFELVPGASYAHFSSVEVYNSRDYNYLEIEIHAPQMLLNPGERYRHSQQWTLGRFSEKTLPADDIYARLTGEKLQRTIR